MKENSGLALAIAAAAVTFFTLLAAIIVVLVYLFITGYAIAKGVGAGGRHPNPPTILVGIAAIVVTLVALLSVGLGLLGRGMDASRDEDAEGGRPARGRGRRAASNA